MALALVGAIAGAFEVLNTSIGWHLAAGRWMLENKSVIRHNPFTLTAESVPWLDHEWLFQVVAAVAEAVAGAPALVVLRIVVVIGLAFAMFRISRYSGLAPAPSLLLVALCIAGARMRFYVRPELATLLLTPLAVHCYLTRLTRSNLRSALTLAAITILGVNLHGGILALPVILGVLLAAEFIREGLARRDPRPHLTSGLSMLITVLAATLVNPWGFRVLAAPIHLAKLVDKEFIPNPEWISPGPTDVPELYLAIVVAGILLSFRERDLVRWALFFVTAALALRYVRNVGLFFVLLPEVIGYALARISNIRSTPRFVRPACLAATAILAALMVDARGFPLGFGFSATRYPVDACSFLDTHGLLSRPVYNDVRFGGWLIGRYYPPTRAFIDDRNEIHEEMLAEMWSIEKSSSVAHWSGLLDRYGCTTALLRYHDPLNVFSPTGDNLGFRGYSALWFPKSQWALVYWDDVAMILVNRNRTDPEWTAAHEYHWVRPDDLEHLELLAGDDPAARHGIEADLARRLQEAPDSGRAAVMAGRIFE